MKCAILVLIFSVGSLFAAVPNEISYQGRLREYGQPVSGTRQMNFKVYQSESGPGLVWESVNLNVSVSTGVFNSILTPANVDWCAKDYWIETVVSGKTLSPREKITAQVYALHSGTSENMKKSSGSSIDFIIGQETKARLSSSGEFSNLVGGTTYYTVPRGAIIMWSGSIASIPSGWALCNGSNGTPDLRDRFILSVSTSEDPGSIGGASSYTLSTNQLPSHSHTGTSEVSGIHDHAVNFYREGGGEYQNMGGTDQTLRGAINTTSNGNHTHNFTTNNTGLGSSIDNRPFYYKLAFIIKE